MSEVLAFLAGGGVALLSQWLSHSLTARREQRADFSLALDKAVGAFASGERVLDDLTDAIERWEYDPAAPGQGTPGYIDMALTDAEHVRVEMRAALFSIRVRLHDRDSPLFRAFDGAFNTWELGFLKSKVIVREDVSSYELKEARGHAARFQGEFYDVALERAAEAVGRLKM